MSAPPPGPLIIIPCLNEEAHLPRLLAFLMSDAPPGSLVVVADGGSTDGTIACAQDFVKRYDNVRLLDNPRRLQSAGVNAAVQQFGSDYKWIIRMDAHLTYPSGYVAGLVATGEIMGVASVVVPMSTQAETSSYFQHALAAVQNTKLGTGGSAHRGATTGRFIDHGHHALFNANAFAKIGGYDEEFSHNEDAEFDIRLRRHGGKIWLEPDLKIVYHPRRALLPLFKQYLSYGAGRARTVQRHRSRLKLRQAAPLAVLPSVGLAASGVVLAPLVGPLALLAVVPTASWAFVASAYGLVLMVGRGDLRLALIGPLAMVMHLAWSCGFWRQTLIGPRPGPEPSPFTPRPLSVRFPRVGKPPRTSTRA